MVTSFKTLLPIVDFKDQNANNQIRQFSIIYYLLFKR